MSSARQSPAPSLSSVTGGLSHGPGDVRPHPCEHRAQESLQPSVGLTRQDPDSLQRHRMSEEWAQPSASAAGTPTGTPAHPGLPVSRCEDDRSVPSCRHVPRLLPLPLGSLSCPPSSLMHRRRQLSRGGAGSWRWCRTTQTDANMCPSGPLSYGGWTSRLS